MIITLISADNGKSDGDTVDAVLLTEVDKPPRRWPVILGARMCISVTVNSEASR